MLNTNKTPFEIVAAVIKEHYPKMNGRLEFTENYPGYPEFTSNTIRSDDPSRPSLIYISPELNIKQAVQILVQEVALLVLTYYPDETSWYSVKSSINKWCREQSEATNVSFDQP